MFNFLGSNFLLALGFLGVVIAIIESRTTQLNQANAALRESEAELRAIFSVMSEVVLVKDREGRYLKIAPTNLTKLLRPPEGLIGKTEYDILPRSQADQFVSYIHQALDTQKSINVEYSLNLGGQEVWFHAHITPLTEQTVIWVARDISDRKRSEIALFQASQEIKMLNEQLQAENLRMGAELAVTRRMQTMLLPKDEELENIEGLDIAGFMEPAAEVGGDYYDVLQHEGKVKIGIGDVTGHGLESGVVMIMAQTAVRTLLANNETNPIKFLNALNLAIYGNTHRMASPKNMSLAIIDYEAGLLRMSGQHEEMIVVRNNGEIEKVDTLDLGFPIGLEFDITPFIAEIEVKLQSGDIAVLYTDGITEAVNDRNEQYGLERMYAVLKQNFHKPANEIRQAVIDHVMQHIGSQKIYDDITLLILKQK